MQTTPKVWGLVDDRAGHTTQTIGLLEHLGLPYSKKELSYNGWAGLPNFCNLSGFAHLDSASRALLAPPYPEMVVAAGRRMVPILRAIKRASPLTRTIYLMWPDKTDGLDVIVAPKHDNPPESEQVITTSAPLTSVNERVLKAAVSTFTQHVEHLPKPWVAVCIGASIKSMRYQMDDWRAMLKSAEKLARGGALLITTSRRTPLEVEAMLEEEITGPSYLHFYHAGAGYNPYMGFLAVADAVCVSGDSLSMCAEVAAAGKPLFIFTPQDTDDSKHTAQHQSLYEAKLAMPLNRRARVGWKPQSENHDMQRVVAAIRAKFPYLFGAKAA